MLERGLEHRHHLLLVAGERPRNIGRPSHDRLGAQVKRGYIVGFAGRPPQVLVQVGRRRKLALGQAVAAVVFDDVDNRHVAAAHVFELTHADIGRVAVAADADTQQLGVGHHRSRCHRRHAAVQRIEAVAGLKEIGRRLLEQPIPLILTVEYGLTPVDLQASIR